MNDTLKGIQLILMIIYVVSPIDACPGPVDDLIVIFLNMMAQKGLDIID